MLLAKQWTVLLVMMKAITINHTPPEEANEIKS